MTTTEFKAVLQEMIDNAEKSAKEKPLSPSDATDCSQAWENPGMTLQIGATYREKLTGKMMKLDGVDMQSNEITLSPAGQDWEGPSQSFATSFVFVAPFSPENDLAQTRRAGD